MLIPDSGEVRTLQSSYVHFKYWPAYQRVVANTIPRQTVSICSILFTVVEIYESTIALHQVAMEAASAKLAAASAACDMYLFRQKEMCSDVILNYKDDSFYAHKSILASRSNFFKKV